eukprot:5951747-Prymnesium_polylepis.1
MLSKLSIRTVTSNVTRQERIGQRVHRAAARLRRLGHLDHPQLWWGAHGADWLCALEWPGAIGGGRGAAVGRGALGDDLGVARVQPRVAAADEAEEEREAEAASGGDGGDERYEARRERLDALRRGGEGGEGHAAAIPPTLRARGEAAAVAEGGRVDGAASRAAGVARGVTEGTGGKRDSPSTVAAAAVARRAVASEAPPTAAAAAAWCGCTAAAAVRSSRTMAEAAAAATAGTVRRRMRHRSRRQRRSGRRMRRLWRWRARRLRGAILGQSAAGERVATNEDRRARHRMHLAAVGGAEGEAAVVTVEDALVVAHVGRADDDAQVVVVEDAEAPHTSHAAPQLVGVLPRRQRHLDAVGKDERQAVKAPHLQ